MPSVCCILVVGGAAAPAILWHTDPVSQFLELLLVGANHQTDDLEGALPVEAVRIGEIEFLALFAVAAIGQEQAPRRLDEHVDGKLRSGIEKRNGGKRVGCILGAAQRRQMELIGERMTHFMKADEEDAAGH